MSSSTWQQHFQSRLAGLEPPREGSFLEAALADGRLTEDEYLDWARPALQLPVLAGNFFSEQIPNPDLLSRVPLGWSSTFFPVAEWDGVLVIACLEAPAQLPPFAVCVLAAPSNMLSWWERLADNAPSALNEVMDGLDLNAQDAAPSGLNFAGLTLANPVPAETVVESAPAAESAAAVPAASAAAATASAEVHVNPSTEPHLLSPLVSAHKSFLQDVALALGELQALFPKAMFLSMNETGKAVVPLVWTQSFGQPNVVSRIPLTTPSPFRIAISTEKPYHGHIVPSDIIEMFSKVWNEGKSPDHLTVVPFFFRNRVVGALAMVGTAEQGTTAALRAAEKVSASLTERLGGKAEDIAAA